VSISHFSSRNLSDLNYSLRPIIRFQWECGVIAENKKKENRLHVHILVNEKPLEIIWSSNQICPCPFLKPDYRYSNFFQGSSADQVLHLKTDINFNLRSLSLSSRCVRLRMWIAEIWREDTPLPFTLLPATTEWRWWSTCCTTGPTCTPRTKGGALKSYGFICKKITFSDRN